MSDMINKYATFTDYILVILSWVVFLILGTGLLFWVYLSWTTPINPALFSGLAHTITRIATAVLAIMLFIYKGIPRIVSAFERVKHTKKSKKHVKPTTF